MTYDTFRTSKTVEEFVKIDNLAWCVGGTRLLSISECGITDVELFRRTDGKNTIIEGCLAYLCVREEVTIQFRFFYVVQLIALPFVKGVEGAKVILPVQLVGFFLALI